MPKLHYRKIVEVDIRDGEVGMEGMPKEMVVAGAEEMSKPDKSLEAAKRRDMI